MIHGDGKQKRDFIFIEDNAKTSVLAIGKGKAGKLIIYIGTGISKDFNAIFKIIKEEMHSILKQNISKIPLQATRCLQWQI